MKISNFSSIEGPIDQRGTVFRLDNHGFIYLEILLEPKDEKIRLQVSINTKQPTDEKPLIADNWIALGHLFEPKELLDAINKCMHVK